MDDLLGDAMEPEDVVPVDLCHAMYHQGGLGWDEMDLFKEPVHHHTNGIVPG